MIQTGVFTLNKTRCSMRDAVKYVVDLFHESAEDRKITLVVEDSTSSLCILDKQHY